MRIIKRNGTEVEFDSSKIVVAIKGANGDVDEKARLDDVAINNVAVKVTDICTSLGRAVSVEEVQDLVENQLMSLGAFELARAYITYRYKRALARKANSTDDSILSLIELANEEVKQENSNKNPTVVSVQRDYMAGEVSKDLTKRLLLPKEVWEAHENGILHFHDSDYFAQTMFNCCLCNLEDMLQNGTVISGTMIEKPHSFYTACNIATQIIAQVASSQYGGQSISLAHLAPFVQVSREKFRKEVREELTSAGMEFTDEKVNEIAEKRVRKEVEHGVQTIQYQVTTLMTTNGQAPFITVFMYLDEVKDEQTKRDLALVIEEVLKQRIVGVKNEKGVYITPAFPKLVYVLDEDNVREGTPYYYLTELAAKCTAKRMVPDYVSAKVMKELKQGDVYAPMGCRSFLTPDTEGLNEDSSHKYYGRFNQGVVTLNLPDIACSSGGDEQKFWELMEERTELAHKALRCRHERLLGTLSDVSPIHWQNGAIARLKKGETIDKLLYNNYSTISLGYAGLNETVKFMKGVSHTDEEGRDFALRVMQFMNDKCSTWRADENISYSVYGTPIESVTYKFAKSLQRRFGVIPGVTDKNYVTNSYH